MGDPSDSKEIYPDCEESMTSLENDSVPDNLEEGNNES